MLDNKDLNAAAEAEKFNERNCAFNCDGCKTMCACSVCAADDCFDCVCATCVDDCGECECSICEESTCVGCANMPEGKTLAVRCACEDATITEAEEIVEEPTVEAVEEPAVEEEAEAIEEAVEVVEEPTEETVEEIAETPAAEEEDPATEAVEEPTVEAVEEPAVEEEAEAIEEAVEVVEEPTEETVEEIAETPAAEEEDPAAEAVEEPTVEAVEEPAVEEIIEETIAPAEASEEEAEEVKEEVPEIASKPIVEEAPAEVVSEPVTEAEQKEEVSENTEALPATDDEEGGMEVSAEEEAMFAEEDEPVEEPDPEEASKEERKRMVEEIKLQLVIPPRRRYIAAPSEIPEIDDEYTVEVLNRSEMKENVQSVFKALIKEGFKLGYLDKYDGLSASEIKEEYEGELVYEVADQELRKVALKVCEVKKETKVGVYAFSWDGTDVHHLGYLNEPEKAAALIPYLNDKDNYIFNVCGIITGGKFKSVESDPKTGKIKIKNCEGLPYGIELDIAVYKKK